MAKTKTPKSLIIVESPTKAKTISRFLGDNYKIESSYGHVRDLPKSKLGIDVEKDFEPQYIIPKKAQKNANGLKKLALTAPKVILATDEDREGEAIAWHLTKLMDLKDYDRITFHEITPEAIKQALESPRKIDEKLVDAQQARRVLDRLVGYELSPFLWQKIRRGLSAGRVQSAALKLIVDRERERQNFKAEEYWSVSAIFEKIKKAVHFESELSAINGKALDKFEINNEKQAKEIEKEIEKCESFIVSDIKRQETKKSPLPPFTTSTLQQDASKKLRFTARQTMRLAQMLYEGQDLGNGSIGLITYMRTDSLNIAASAITKCREVIEEKYGKENLPSSPNYYKNKSKGAQEAHEAIRPTHPEILPSELKDKVDNNLYKLYNLIWQRFIASQMNPAIFDRIAICIIGENKNKYLFKTNGNTLKFEGFLKAYPMQFQEVQLPNLEKDEEVKLDEIKPEQHFTQPPARFNEASLIKTLEENGIGRPSTYAPIISVIQDRFYVEKDEERRFFPTELGFIVNDILAKHFPQITDINFTAQIEKDLDEVAEGKEKWKQIIKNFYWPFKENLIKKYDEVAKEDFQEKTDEICDKCGKPMLVKWSKFGKFLGCSGFPECRNIKKIIDASKKVTGVKCPKCKEGDVVIKRTKAKKRMFYGCSRWPDCDFVSWKKPTSENGEENGD